MKRIERAPPLARVVFLALATLLLAPPLARAQGLVAQRFLDAGVPAVTRRWNGQDYIQAAKVFASGKAGLPRASDADGEAVLARMTSADNFAYDRDETLPLRLRMPDFMDLSQGSNDIFKQYLRAAAAAHPEDWAPELSRMMVFALREGAQLVELVDEFLPQMPHDSTYATRLQGLQHVRQGATSIFNGAEITLTEPNGFTHAQRLAVLSAMAETLPRIKEALPAEYRVELRRRLDADRASFPEPAGRALIDDLQRELAP